MSAGIIFDKQKIEKALTDLGCEPIENAIFKGKKTPPHRMWKTSWNHMFMVPVEGCGHWVIQEIIDKEVTGTKPKQQ